jgi:hypothetical protein
VLTVGVVRGEKGVSKQELKYPAWQLPLQDVILEFNLDTLRGKIQQVETLIFQRLQELQHSKDGAGERQAINDALDLLRTVKHERLDYPNWK